MTTKSRIAPPVPQVESPLRHLPLVDQLVDTKTELLELALRSGLRVFTTMLEEDRTAICGPRYAHEPERPASRAGSTQSEVVLGGRKSPFSARAFGPWLVRSRCRHFRRWPPPIRSIVASSSRCWWAWPRVSTRGAWSRLGER